ncbi:ribosomal protein S18-alanine N-acetyltransferase [Utexia brackfieldae]|uniref:ribosomal protein S18-alanine N-acetyltransferase n=1 Tax=Utexia brackfieldae TaxID=3074108 RepID=UPI00370D6EF9
MNTISKLNETDFTRAYQIETQSHAFPWTENVFRSNQGERYLNYKIEENGQIAGFCIINMIVDEATLFNIAVAPNFQRQGLAKQLLTFVLDELTQRKMTTCWLEVRASNQAAIKLYEQVGFNQISVRPNYYPAANHQREDAIIMANMLNF